MEKYHSGQLNFDQALQQVVIGMGLSSDFNIKDNDGKLSKYAIDRLGCVAYTIWSLAKELALGIDSENIINPIINENITGFILDSNSSTEIINNSNQEPWSGRNRLAEQRLPKSGCIFCRAVKNRLKHRGDGRYSKIK